MSDFKVGERVLVKLSGGRLVHGIGVVRVPIQQPELVAGSCPDDEYPCRLFGLRGKK